MDYDARTGEESASNIDEARTIRKIFLHTVPLLMLLYFLSYLDRINVGFAALTMNKDIGLTAYLYGWGAGIFFVGYFICEIPSNLLMEKFGARRWFARILVTWGLLSCLMAFVQGEISFLVLRFFLGAAEAGFFPGVILYLTYWFPNRYRARIVAAFIFAVPVSGALGAPISTWLLTLDGLHGLKGWQWLYLAEGLPAILATFLVLRFITDKPSEAGWLTHSEKRWLTQQLETDAANSSAADKKTGLVHALFSPTIIALALIWFFNTGANLGLSFFLPQVIKLHGFSTQNVGWISGIPYVAGCFGMLLCGYLSDKFQAPRSLVVVPTILICVGFAIAGFLPGSNVAIAGLALAAIGILGAKGPFWVVCSANMDKSTAAGAIAFVNAVGNLGGLVAPVVLGYLRDRSEDFSSGLYALSASAIITLILIAIFLNRPERPSRTVAKTA